MLLYLWTDSENKLIKKRDVTEDTSQGYWIDETRNIGGEKLKQLMSIRKQYCTENKLL